MPRTLVPQSRTRVRTLQLSDPPECSTQDEACFALAEMQLRIELGVEELLFQPTERWKRNQQLFDQLAARRNTSRELVSREKDPESADFAEQLSADSRLGELLNELIAQVQYIILEGDIPKHGKIPLNRISGVSRKVLTQMLRPDPSRPGNPRSALLPGDRPPAAPRARRNY